MAKPYQIKLRRTSQTIDTTSDTWTAPAWWKSAQGNQAPVNGEPVVITSGQDKLIAVGDGTNTKPKFFKAFKSTLLPKFTFWRTGELSAASNSTIKELTDEAGNKIHPYTGAMAVYYNPTSTYPENSVGDALKGKADASGGTLTNATLTTSEVSAPPTTNLGIANKQYVDNTITSAVAAKAHTWYGTSSTGASTTAKTVTCVDYTLAAGSIITVLFTTANTAATPTLNVNSTGAKSIYVGTTAPNATDNVLKWSANTLVTFVYDGTQYRYISSSSASTVSPSRGANTWYGTDSSSASTASKTVTCANFVLTRGAIISIKFTNANTADALKLNVNSTGAKPVRWNGVETSTTNKFIWIAGEQITFLYEDTNDCYHVLSASNFASRAYVSEQIAAGVKPVISGTAPSNTDVIWIKPVTASINGTSTTELILHVYYNSAWRPISSIW